MKLEALYRKAVETGIANDLRGREEVLRVLADEKERFDKLPDAEKDDFDRDRLFNPFADTRILNGDPGLEVRTAIVGIDMEIGEVLLAHTLNRDLGAKIDLVIAHHPEGYALARLHDVMRLQSDLLAACGVPVAVAEQLMEKRIGEVERRLLPVNHETGRRRRPGAGPPDDVHPHAGRQLRHELPHAPLRGEGAADPRRPRRAPQGDPGIPEIGPAQRRRPRSSAAPRAGSAAGYSST